VLQQGIIEFSNSAFYIQPLSRVPVGAVFRFLSFLSFSFLYFFVANLDFLTDVKEILKNKQSLQDRPKRLSVKYIATASPLIES